MQNMIEALYNGEIRPVEQIVLNDTEYQKQIRRQTETLDRLAPTLTKEQNSRLEEYLNQANKTQTYLHQKIFHRGFSIGVRLFLDGAIRNYS